MNEKLFINTLLHSRDSLVEKGLNKGNYHYQFPDREKNPVYIRQNDTINNSAELVDKEYKKEVENFRKIISPELFEKIQNLFLKELLKSGVTEYNNKLSYNDIVFYFSPEDPKTQIQKLARYSQIFNRLEFNILCIKDFLDNKNEEKAKREFIYLILHEIHHSYAVNKYSVANKKDVIISGFSQSAITNPFNEGATDFFSLEMLRNNLVLLGFENNKNLFDIKSEDFIYPMYREYIKMFELCVKLLSKLVNEDYSVILDAAKQLYFSGDMHRSEQKHIFNEIIENIKKLVKQKSETEYKDLEILMTNFFNIKNRENAINFNKKIEIFLDKYYII